MTSNSRPQWTETQKRAAVAALEEIRNFYNARLDHQGAVIALYEAMDGYAVPVPAALSSAAGFNSLTTLGEGVDELAGMIAAAEIVPAELSNGAAHFADAVPAGRMRAAA